MTVGCLGVATAAYGPLVATLAGVPQWAGLLVAGLYVFGVPLIATFIVKRFSRDWADRIFALHFIAMTVAFLGFLVCVVGVTWYCVAS